MIVGTGLSGNAEVTLTVDTIEISTIPLHVITDPCGSFTAMIILPSSTPGDYTVTGFTTDNTNSLAISTYTLIKTQGPKGDQGATGPQGLKGEKGDTGAQGEKGRGIFG